MDLQALMSTMLSEESIQNLGAKAEASPDEVRGVLGSALPLLLNGANAQATNQDTASGFLGALQQHAQDDASNVGSFLGGVDMADGAKIIGHLFGGNTGAQTQAVAQQAGVSQAKTGNILAAVAPLLLTLLGQQAASGSNSANNNALGIGSLMGSLLGSGDMTSMLGSMLGMGGAAAPAQQAADPFVVAPAAQQAAQPAQQASKPTGLLGKLLGLLK